MEDEVVLSLRHDLETSGDVGANEYQETCARTRGDFDGAGEQLKFGIAGLASEAGEVANKVYKVLWQGHPLDARAIALEVGDVLWFLATICDALNISLAETMAMNQEKLAKRYPEKFSTADSIARVDEREAEPEESVTVLPMPRVWTFTPPTRPGPYITVWRTDGAQVVDGSVVEPLQLEAPEGERDDEQTAS